VTSRQVLLLAVIIALTACAGEIAVPPRIELTQSPIAMALSATPTWRPTLITSPTSTPAASCTETSGEIRAESYSGTAVSGEVPYFIYLPPCYAETERSYPAVYMLHGLPFDERHWMELGVISVAELGIKSRDWQPLLLIFPLQPDPLFTGSDGGPGSYESEFMDGLVPHIEASYSTDPSQRGIAGISRGGVWALEIAFNNPDAIIAVAALSPALAVNSPRPAFDPFELAQFAMPLQILLMAGDQDWALVETRRLSDTLLEYGAQHSLSVIPGDHSDPTWANALAAVLGFFGNAWSGP
jgi:enterochelin esterase-like enzyme